MQLLVELRGREWERGNAAKNKKGNQGRKPETLENQVLTLWATWLTPVWLLAIFSNTDVRLLSKHHLKLMTVYLLKIDLGKKPIILIKLISTPLNKPSPLSSPLPCQCFFHLFLFNGSKWLSLHASNQPLQLVPTAVSPWQQLLDWKQLIKHLRWLHLLSHLLNHHLVAKRKACYLGDC